jgi:hypothetical protein
MRWLLLLTLTACPPAPVPPPPPDASDAAVHFEASAFDAADSYAAACGNLAAIGCKDGADPNCAVVLKHAVDARITPVDVSCLTHAKDVSAAKVCGFVACK